MGGTRELPERHQEAPGEDPGRGPRKGPTKKPRRGPRREPRKGPRRGAEDNKEMAEETFLRPPGGLLGASRRPKGYRRATEMLPKAAGRLRVRLMVGAPRYDS